MRTDTAVVEQPKILIGLDEVFPNRFSKRRSFDFTAVDYFLPNLKDLKAPIQREI